ncbi:hypothetical protein FRB94_005484 [Tulasnella sp. JGI-2019a]|nr:hypothetical protein FRB93_006117 [Tulasnella sp. JGI-2019a]KAG9000382.1 hypothetical protein FRB94_005484 [Tulasnella sp. JGI-2019a]KAG9029435.1 hypothetical protein FRB95_005328 [Tulasnella sp. JGI-2019a]
MSPRPILKHSTSSSSSYSSSTSPIKTSVSFSTNISTTYFTHGASTYNRSPIQVDFNECALERGRSAVRNPRRSHDWDEYVDGFGSIMVREDEGTDEYYDRLTPLPPSFQAASVYAPSPSAYSSYRDNSASPDSSSPSNRTQSPPASLLDIPSRYPSCPSLVPADVSASCLDGF